MFQFGVWCVCVSVCAQIYDDLWSNFVLPSIVMLLIFVAWLSLLLLWSLLLLFLFFIRNIFEYMFTLCVCIWYLVDFLVRVRSGVRVISMTYIRTYIFIFLIGYVINFIILLLLFERSPAKATLKSLKIYFGYVIRWFAINNDVILNDFKNSHLTKSTLILFTEKPKHKKIRNFLMPRDRTLSMI